MASQIETSLRKITGWIRVEPLVAVVLWGGVYPSAKLGLQEIPTLSFAYLRVILATFVLVWASERRGSGSSRFLWKPALSAGAAQAAFQLLLIAGLARTTAGTSAILLAASPLIVAGWQAITTRERVPGHHWVGLLVGLAGVALVVRGGMAGLDGIHLSGNLVALAAAGAWAWYSLAIGPLVGAVGAIRATGWAMAIAGVVITPVALGQVAALSWRGISWVAWAGLVYGATAGMVVAMSLWGRSLGTLGPRQTMVYAYFEPVSAVIIAAVLLGEALRPIQAVGALLTFAGVWLGSGGRPER
jgi:drug/metabolite transporter (DMT)-like permease